MNTANLNMLFQQLIPNFVHLITTENQTKVQFLDRIKETYSLKNPKNELFFISCQKLEFDTIKLNEEKTAILFNE